MKTPRPSQSELSSNGVVEDRLLPIFDTLKLNKESQMESRSEREDRYMIIRDIQNIADPSKWRVHKYFQEVFCQILGILLGLFLVLINLT